jgi:lipoprotein-anchoring transpeptidase ErfK/SrfK
MRKMFALGLALAALTLANSGVLDAAPTPDRTSIVATQVMLDRAGFSPGEIDGRTGPNLQRAMEAFEKAGKQLAAVEALVPYEIQAADVNGPFTRKIPADLMAQSKLEALRYTTALEELAERFHASPRLLRELNPGAQFSRAGERVMVPNVGGTEIVATGPVTIVVTKETSALTLEGAQGEVVFHAPVTTGSEHDPLPVGTWKVTGVQRNPPFHYNPDLFWDANPAHSKAKIAPGPNNPVGVAWIDISKEHYGIHGTPEPSRIGHVQSHGCVRMTNWDVLRVAQLVKPGTVVIFR